MQAEITKQGNVVVVRLLDARLNAEAATALREKLVEAVRAGERTIIINIASVEFIDSSGLGALVAVKKAMAEDGVLTITGTQEPVMTLFRLTRMHRLFKMSRSEEEALRELSGHADKCNG